MHPRLRRDERLEIMRAGTDDEALLADDVDPHGRDCDQRDVPARAIDVAVIGLGYVGLTLAVALADSGSRVLGYDASPAVTAALRAGHTPFYEPGTAETLRALPPRQLTVVDDLPARLPPAVVICVGTPVDETTSAVDLRHLRAAVAAIASRLAPDTAVIVRSTVPVGTSRDVVLPALAAHSGGPAARLLPRTDDPGPGAARTADAPPGRRRPRRAVSGARGARFFGRLSPIQVRVSSLEAAELVKLVNNAHTDLIYGFGNEVAMIAEVLGVDADEVVSAANVGYPRPDLCRPGFVGGGCLTKDPYLLMSSVADAGYRPPLVAAARQLNESVPDHVAERVLRALKEHRRDVSDAKVLVCGLAYKGRPATDDIRGTPARTVIARLRAHVGTVVAHDHLVDADRAAALGAPLVELDEGFEDADAIVFLVDHSGYAALDPRHFVARMRRPAIVADVWGLFKSRLEPAPPGVVYMRLGRG